MIYRNDTLKEVLFPIGGIGSGSISIAGNGILRDFEIFNRPNKGSLSGFTHFAVRVTDADGKAYVRAVCGDVTKDLTGQYSKGRFSGYGYGVATQTMNGFPHFRDVTLNAEFPFAEFTFSDPDFPGKIVLTAWNPLIPSDDKNSSIPAAFFRLRYVNDTPSDKEVLFAFSVASPFDCAANTAFEAEDFRGVQIRSTDDPASTGYGDLTLVCPAENSHAQPFWYRGDWCDAVVTYWRELSAGAFSDRRYDAPGKDHATLSRKLTVLSGQDAETDFVLAWNVPNNTSYWHPVEDNAGKQITWKNYYATLFEDSKASALYSVTNLDDLYRRTFAYKEALFSSTLPDYVIDAAADTLSVLKTATVLRLEDGSFYGWEGMHENEGSCEGTCQHVWNYAYAMCFLFPKLERSIRDLEFDYQTDEDGKMDFRLKLPLGKRPADFLSCVDGQMGAVIKSYREWLISGDDEWLFKRWDSIKKVLEYAWNPDNPFRWDENKTGVVSGRMHHTLDMELFGPNAWLEGFYLAALKAAAIMADYVGDSTAAGEYRTLFEKGYAWTKENLFNGSYFIQKIDLTDKSVLDRFDCAARYWNEETGEIKYQTGEGCDIDQLCGQWHADILGLGRLFDNEQIHTAAESLYRNNFKKSLRGFVNPWRVFSLNDESGAVICDYPAGARKPTIPIPYCEETMHGFEYQLAGLLIAEGYMDEGLSIVKSIRDRYNGSNRNPFNEIECGSNYARSMASFALLPLLSGFIFDLPHGKIGFEPKINKTGFRCFWSLSGGWGIYEKEPDKTVISLTEGSLTVQTLALPYLETVSSVTIDGKPVPFTFDHGEIRFDRLTVCKDIIIK